MWARPWPRPGGSSDRLRLATLVPGRAGSPVLGFRSGRCRPGLGRYGCPAPARATPHIASRSLERYGWSSGVDGETRGLEPHPRLTPLVTIPATRRAASGTVTPPRRRTRSSGPPCDPSPVVTGACWGERVARRSVREVPDGGCVVGRPVAAL